MKTEKKKYKRKSGNRKKKYNREVKSENRKNIKGKQNRKREM